MKKSPFVEYNSNILYFKNSSDSCDRVKKKKNYKIFWWQICVIKQNLWTYFCNEKLFVMLKILWWKLKIILWWKRVCEEFFFMTTFCHEKNFFMKNTCYKKKLWGKLNCDAKKMYDKKTNLEQKKKKFWWKNICDEKKMCDENKYVMKTLSKETIFWQNKFCD